MSTHNIGLILMSTLNIGFDEDLTKIVFQISSNTHLSSYSVINSIRLYDAHLISLDTLLQEVEIS